jgi:O-antigen biosynthesis protein
LTTALPANQFHFDANLGVWMHESHRGFKYSEGKTAEKKILEILQAAEDRSVFSEALGRQISDWSTRYHFSPQRHALLRHLKIPASLRVLELGAGCGAITRFLGETGAQVWAVEGSRSRAACVAARTRDLSNVRVLCGDFQSLQTDQRFDVVTLIGVLEYAPKFFKSGDPLKNPPKNPLAQCLKLVRSLLKPDGTLVLAIENQLGLKYFCSAPEDHTGEPFDGIQDLYETGGPRTLGRKELNRLLTSAGFSSVQFQYPFPDYKLPGWVLTQRAFEMDGFDPCAILHGIDPTHEGQATQYPADERKIWPVLHRNGILTDLANSFLVLAGASGESRLSSPSLLAAGYVMERRACFNIQTQFLVDERGEISVHKTPLTSAPPPADIPVRHSPSVETYRRGPQLEQQIVGWFQHKSVELAIAGLSRWIEFVVEQGLSEKNSKDIFESLLKPEFFDCNPRNLILVNGSLEQIDMEWRYLGRLPLRNHVLRYLKLLAGREEKVLRACLPGKTSLVQELCEQLKMPVSKEQFEQYKNWQHQLNHWIVGEKRKTKRSIWRRMLSL